MMNISAVLSVFLVVLCQTGVTSGVMIRPLRNVTVTTGQTVVLRCKIDKAPLDASHSWTRQGLIVYAKSVKMFQDSRISLLTNKPYEYTIEIQDVTPADEGEYICTVYGNAAEIRKSSMFLTVNVPPTMTKVSSDQTIDEGNVITLECLAQGKPEPKIYWRHVLPSADGKRAISEYLPLGEVTRGSAGSYECTADNGVSSPITRSIELTVRYPPQIDKSGKQTTQVALGGNVELSCFASGYPEPKFIWYHPYGETFRSSQDRFNIVKLNAGSSVQSTLLVTKVAREDFGNWSCVAANSLGRDNQTLILTRTFMPPTRLPPSLVFGPARKSLLSGGDGGGASSIQLNSVLKVFLYTIAVLPVIFL